MSSPRLAPIPTDAPLLQLDLDGKPTPYLSADWYLWFFAQANRVQQAPPVLGTPTSLTSQSASIGTTALTLPALSGGVYRVSWYARITTAATVSSSLTVTIGFTETAITLSTSGSAITGNTTTTTQSGSVLLQIDAASSLTYSTTYASVGATSMVYRLSLTCEQVA
jgi:hypothetical protein